MGRNGINDFWISDAITELAGRQENITIDNIRAHFGTGSKSTVARHFNEWKMKNSIAGGESILPQELLSLVKGLWEHCQEKAEQKITGHQQTTDNQLQTLQTHLQKIQQQQAHTLEEKNQWLIKLESELKWATQKSQQQEQETQQLRNDLETMQKNYHLLNQEKAQLIGRFQQLKTTLENKISNIPI